jgi:hypothetical protein
MVTTGTTPTPRNRAMKSSVGAVIRKLLFTRSHSIIWRRPATVQAVWLLFLLKHFGDAAQRGDEIGALLSPDDTVEVAFMKLGVVQEIARGGFPRRR